MRRVQIAHRETTNWSDWVALGTVRVFRRTMDFVTGYKHPEPGQKLPPKFEMNEKKWLARFIFLESVAGVPGMVGGMLRHLRSLRKMKRDNGWYVPAQRYCAQEKSLPFLPQDRDPPRRGVQRTHAPADLPQTR